MRRTASILTCCALILLLGVAEAIAAGGATPLPTGWKSTGPAVNGTILISPPFSPSRTDGTFAIKLSKGTLQSGAVVLSGLVLREGECTTDSARIANRFLGGPSHAGGLLSSYFENSNVLIEIFGQLGITISLNNYEPLITDVNNAVCSPANTATGTLSLDVTIQFAGPK